ncbi:MAG: hypothetical protein IPM25_00325 [Chloracidobacterium sp.]|nr:hypothetical protein [Chloracidobacterium sp.]
MHSESELHSERRPFKRSDAVFFAAAFVFLYTQLFQFPNTPYYFEGDHLISVSNALRMLSGEVIYRDFFHLASPGVEVFYLAMFSIFGVRIWILTLAILLLSLAQTSIIWYFSRRIFDGLLVYVPAAIFLIAGFRLFLIDGAYRLFSLSLVLAAAAVLFDKRSVRTLITAGALCGLASFFMQPRGLMGVVGISLFLCWEEYRNGFELKRLAKNILAVALPFLFVFVALHSYFVFQAGFDNVYFSLVTFLREYYPNDPLARPTAFLADFPDLARLSETYTPLSALSRFFRILAPTLFYYLIIPWVYIVFLLVRRRKCCAIDDVTDRRLMLLTIVGLALCAGISVVTVMRLSHVAIPGIILLVWLLSRISNFRRAVPALLVLFALAGTAYIVQRQTISKYFLDTPAGRTAFFSEQVYRRYKWIGENTKPGDRLYEPHHPSFYFPFHLVNPTPMYLIRDNGYTPDFQVEAVVRALAENPPKLIIWPRKWSKTAESRAHDDSLEILWQFVQANYEPRLEFSRTSDYHDHSEGDLEIWALKRR